MELYEVEATRWYFSEVFYRVVAKDESDAFQQAHKMEKGVVETSATAPEWNGEEEYLDAYIIETAHDMSPTDNVQYDHTNCQYIGNNLWNCGHSDLTIGESGWIQLPLWPSTKSWNVEN